MGGLRLLLAMSVVAGHAPGFYQAFFLINAGIAVNCFFVISGFYMALVINEKYKPLPNWRTRFITARGLRLYPTYCVILAAFVGFDLYRFGDSLLFSFEPQEPWQAFFPAVNYFIIGQDWIMWLRDIGVDIPNPVIVLPAWSIASELTFYVAAAFMFHRRSGIVLFFMAAFAFFWSARALDFPASRLVFDLAIYFGLGGVSYLIYERVRRWPTQGVLVLCLIGLALWFTRCWYGLDGRSQQTALYTITTATIPFLFILMEKSTVDSFLGELSYPIYLVHPFIINIAAHYSLHTMTIAAGTIFAAIVIVALVERPFSRLRMRLSAKDRTRSAFGAAAAAT